MLFRRKNAPTRYAEFDIYFANERNLHGELPSSDLLKAIHTYVSDFYSQAIPDSGITDVRSMDETALLAMGILLEESIRDVLGRTGDLVFTEGREEDSESGIYTVGRHSRARSTRSAASITSEVLKVRKKRRRLLDPDTQDTAASGTI